MNGSKYETSSIKKKYIYICILFSTVPLCSSFPFPLLLHYLSTIVELLSWHLPHHSSQKG